MSETKYMNPYADILVSPEALLGKRKRFRTSKINQMKKQGKEIHEDDKKIFLDEIQQRYTEQTEVLYAASRLWIDEIIDPLETRKIISRCIEITNNNPVIKKFNVGMIQT